MDEFEMGEEPTTCPKCGARTTFDEPEDGVQVHYCSNCRYGFAVSVEDEVENAVPIRRLTSDGRIVWS